MKLHDLAPVPGSRKNRKRIGMGLGSGTGQTSGKGHKGQKARAGRQVRLNFEGGQMPLVRRMPKRGFSNFRHETRYQTVNLCELESRFEAGTEIDVALLCRAGLVDCAAGSVKILGNGELTKNYVVRANAFSASAVAKIETAGGKAEVI